MQKTRLFHVFHVFQLQYAMGSSYSNKSIIKAEFKIKIWSDLTKWVSLIIKIIVSL